jgi:hypothetical protein
MNEGPKDWTKIESYLRPPEEDESKLDRDIWDLSQELKNAQAMHARGALTDEDYQDIDGRIGDSVIDIIVRRIVDETSIDILHGLARTVASLFKEESTVSQAVGTLINARIKQLRNQP